MFVWSELVEGIRNIGHCDLIVVTSHGHPRVSNYKCGHLAYCHAYFILGTARKTRILDVVYNASNNELVRTKTLVKNCIVQIDSTPFRQW